jgi:hypothetical protein
MRQWLVTDLSFFDIHFQLWMLLVTAVVVIWFLYAWARRGKRRRRSLASVPSTLALDKGYF